MIANELTFLNSSRLVDRVYGDINREPFQLIDSIKSKYLRFIKNWQSLSNMVNIIKTTIHWQCWLVIKFQENVVNGLARTFIRVTLIGSEEVNSSESELNSRYIGGAFNREKTWHQFICNFYSCRNFITWNYDNFSMIPCQFLLYLITCFIADCLHKIYFCIIYP